MKNSPWLRVSFYDLAVLRQAAEALNLERGDLASRLIMEKKMDLLYVS